MSRASIAALLATLTVFSAGRLKAQTSADSSASESQRLFNQAVGLFNSTDYREARKMFAEVVDPRRDQIIRYYLGVCSYQIGDYAHALRYLSDVSPVDSLYSLASFYKAETMMALHNPRAALGFLALSLSGDSSFIPARLEYVRALCAIDSFDAAEKFVGHDPDEEGALVIARSLVAAKKYRDAYPFLASVIERDSDNALAQSLLGETYYETQKYPYAEETYSGMISTFGESPFLVHRLALCYGNMDGVDNLEKAIAAMNMYFAISGDTSADDLGHIGTWYYALARYDSAELYFRKEIENDFSDPQARLNLGLALMQLDKPEEAMRSMSLAYTLSQNTMAFSISILKSLSAAELRVKQYHEAIKNYGLIIELTPNDVEAMYGLGLAYDQSGRTAKSIYWYKKFLGMQPSPGINKSFSLYARQRLSQLTSEKH